MTESRKIYLDDKGEGIIICPECGRKKTVAGARYAGAAEPVRVKCPCGSSFTVTFENRKYYRKKVHLHGEYARQDPPREVGGMVVLDISQTGVGFRTNLKHNIQPGDVLKVTFKLDDSAKSLISRNVAVKRVVDRQIGAEFCDSALNRNLAFYLLP